MTTTASVLPFDAVLCDLDGVIRFFDHGEVERLARAAGLADGAVWGAAFGGELGQRLVLGEVDRPQWVAQIAGRLGEVMAAPAAEELARAFAYSPARADAEAVALLRRARAHVPVLLVTNATVWLEEDLAALGLTDLADQVVNSARVGHAKPDQRIYRLAAERAGTTPDRCLFVDDRAENTEAAAALGMRTALHRSPADLAAALAPLWA
ncbi:HAD-IA family hydrolase [Kitasatospora sp. NPDC002227]|uniref:HAD family hydrolase n=1 Tax=Kitasatospora sp. NPDC002227 TaxID=3154773 RepID=UPI0033257D48